MYRRNASASSAARSNPTNRWGVTFKKGDIVQYQGSNYRYWKLDKADDFSRAYGRQAVLTYTLSGPFLADDTREAGIGDLTKPRSNPARKNGRNFYVGQDVFYNGEPAIVVATGLPGPYGDRIEVAVGRSRIITSGLDHGLTTSKAQKLPRFSELMYPSKATTARTPSVRSNPRVTKYEYLLVLQGYYGQGWEDLTAVEKKGSGFDGDANREIKALLKNYRDNERGTYRVINRKVVR
jgi:hypothetical protein